MNEERRGGEWHPGMRVRVFNHYETPGQIRIGTITERAWGRDRGKPIWRYVVKLDDVDDEWVFEPGEVSAPEE